MHTQGRLQIGPIRNAAGAEEKFIGEFFERLNQPPPRGGRQMPHAVPRAGATSRSNRDFTPWAVRKSPTDSRGEPIDVNTMRGLQPFGDRQQHFRVFGKNSVKTTSAPVAELIGGAWRVNRSASQSTTGRARFLHRRHSCGTTLADCALDISSKRSGRPVSARRRSGAAAPLVTPKPLCRGRAPPDLRQGPRSLLGGREFKKESVSGDLN